MNWKHMLAGVGFGLLAVWIANNVSAVGNIVGKK